MRISSSACVFAAVFQLSAASLGAIGVACADEFGNQYGLSNVGAEIAFGSAVYGKNSRVAVFDTAVDITHPEFNGRIGGSFDIYTGLANSGFDGFHGTHVAGIIAANLNGTGMAGVAPRATLLPVTILLTSPGAVSGGISSAAINSLVPRGFDYAVAQSVDVINHSWGISIDVTQPGLTSGVMEMVFGDFIAASQRSVDAGIVNVWATGNNSFQNSSIYGGLPYLFPGLQSSWIAVTALDPDGTIAPYANRCGVTAQWCIAAPGTNIYSTFPLAFTPYFAISGTSMAAPHVSGAVAIAREVFPNASGAQLTQLLLQTATDIGVPGIDPIYGWGALSVGNIVNAASPATAGLYANAGWSRLSTMGTVLRALPNPGVTGPIGADRTPVTALAYGPSDETPAPFRTEPASHSSVFWMNGIYGHSEIGAGPTSTGATSAAKGFLAGTQFQVYDNFILGFGGGLTQTSLHGSGVADAIDTLGYHAIAYASWRDEGWFVDGVGQIAYFDETFSRSSISGAGTTAAFIGRANGAAAAGALHVAVGRSVRTYGVDIEPYLAGSARWQRWGGLTETGAGIFALTVQPGSSQHYEAGFGARAHLPDFMIGNSHNGRFSLDLSYAHLMGDRAQRASAGLLGNSLQATTAELGAHIFRVGADFSVELNGGQAMAVLSYDGQFQSKAHTHGASLALKVRF